MAVLGLGIVTNGWLSRIHHDVLGYATDVSSQALLASTNTERFNLGKSNLQLDPKLSSAAQAKANDMVTRNYWSHTTPDGQQPWKFIAAAGYSYQTAGENLAYGFGTSSEVLEAWMHSPEHRANVLNDTYSQVGFAVANSPNFQGHGPETVIVALYAEPSGGVAGASTPGLQVGSSPQSVSRVQLIAPAMWTELAIAAICGGTITLFVIRHSFAWRKVLVRGEQFALHHPFFDVFLIGTAVFGFLLSHIAGNIL